MKPKSLLLGCFLLFIIIFLISIFYPLNRTVIVNKQSLPHKTIYTKPVYDEDIENFLSLTRSMSKSLMSFRKNKTVYLDKDMSKECMEVIKSSIKTRNFNSQMNQDYVLYQNLFRNYKHGFYLDVGAYKPKSLSNTWFFDQCLGWDGICIEPYKPNADLLSKGRTCHVVHMGVYNTKGILKSRKSSLGYTRIEKKNKRIGNENNIKVDTIDNILNDLNVTKIDFASIDTDGVELEAIQAFDLRKYKVDYVVMELIKEYSNVELIHKIFEMQGYIYIMHLNIDRLYMKGPIFENNWIKKTKLGNNLYN